MSDALLTLSAGPNAIRSGLSIQPGVNRFAWLATVRHWIERSRQRTALRELAKFNQHLLGDIGVSQDEALREAAKPFWR